MKNSAHKICEGASPVRFEESASRNVNPLCAILGRGCFVVYLFLVVAAVFSVGMFLVCANGFWLAGMLAAILGVGVLRYVGYAYLSFEKHQESLDIGFECREVSSEFELWFRRIEDLDRMPDGELWERYHLRTNLLREYRSHPGYSRRLHAKGYRPPDWLRM